MRSVLWLLVDEGKDITPLLSSALEALQKKDYPELEMARSPLDYPLTTGSCTHHRILLPATPTLHPPPPLRFQAQKVQLLRCLSDLCLDLGESNAPSDTKHQVVSRKQ